MKRPFARTGMRNVIRDIREFRKKLLSIPGIGTWTAETICLRALGDTDAFPATDLALKRAVTVGKPVGGMVPILTGLKEGEPLVVSGTFILKAELGKSEASHEH